MNKHASLDSISQPRLLMCRPQHFAVTYSINPWMDPHVWAESGETLNVYVATTLLNWTSKTNGQPTPDRLKEFLETRPRADAPALAEDILAGKIRGRIVFSVA